MRRTIYKAKREAHEANNLRKTIQRIKDRTMTRQQYKMLHHNTRRILWRIKQLPKIWRATRL